MGDKEGLDIEDALDAVGSWDRYQKLILLMSLISAIPNAFVALHFVFSQYEPNHHCAYPAEYRFNRSGLNVSEQDIISTIIPLEPDHQNEYAESQCRMYDRNYSQYPTETWPKHFKIGNGTNVTDCANGMTWEYWEGAETAVMEFSMVCNDDWKAPVAVSMYHIGMGLGSVMGATADWYGRRPVFIVASGVQVVSQLLCAVSWNFATYCISIVFNGICGLMNYVVFFVLTTEVTDHRWRNSITLASSVGFSTGYCLIALFGYLFQSWRTFIGALTVTSTIIYVPCCWLVCSSIYFAFSIYSTDYSRDRYVTAFLGGVVEIPAYAVAFVMLETLGRPRTALLLMSLCGVSSIILPFVPEDLSAMSTVFAILGKGSITAVFFDWYLIVTETVPTLQRSSSLSICSAAARVGSMVTPYLMYFRKFNYFAPNVAMGIASILAGILAVFFVPETWKVNLPDTVEEAKDNIRFYGMNILKKFQTSEPNCHQTSKDDEKTAMITQKDRLKGQKENEHASLS